MRPGDGAELLGPGHSYELLELPQVMFIGCAGMRIAEIGKPLDFWGDISEFAELRRG